MLLMTTQRKNREFYCEFILRQALRDCPLQQWATETALVVYDKHLVDCFLDFAPTDKAKCTIPKENQKQFFHIIFSFPISQLLGTEAIKFIVRMYRNLLFTIYIISILNYVSSYSPIWPVMCPRHQTSSELVNLNWTLHCENTR